MDGLRVNGGWAEGEWWIRRMVNELMVNEVNGEWIKRGDGVKEIRGE